MPPIRRAKPRREDDRALVSGGLLRVMTAADETSHLDRLAEQVRDVPAVALVGATRASGDMEDVAAFLPDLLLIDIDTGAIDLPALAARLPTGASIVVVSRSPDQAAAAFDAQAVDYIVKPVSHARLCVALDRARRRRDQQIAYERSIAACDVSGAIMIPGRHGRQEVPVSAISHVEAARDYVLIHTPNRCHMVRTTMTEFASALPPALVRVHRGSFVAIGKVSHWRPRGGGDHSLMLTDGTEVLVGPTFLSAARAVFRHLPTRARPAGGQAT